MLLGSALLGDAERELSFIFVANDVLTFTHYLLFFLNLPLTWEGFAFPALSLNFSI